MTKTERAIKNYKQFNWFKPGKVLRGKIGLKPGERLKYIGSVPALWYRSAKMDKITRIHMHDFPGPVMAFKNSGNTAIIILPVTMSELGII
jgi:hypothetical protein